MTSRRTNLLKSLLHPYIFVLKEGREIKDDFLDYSLMMLFIHSTETIRSPLSAQVSEELLKKRLKNKKTSIKRDSGPMTF